MRALLCTREGRVIRLELDGASPAARTVLDGEPAVCVAAAGERVLVGTQGDGLLLSEDGGEEWERVELPERDVLSVAIGAPDGALYAGTEPSRLFVCRDGARWEELEALQDIPSRAHWSFPPRPWTHHVRSIAPHPRVADRLLIGIELGGLMRSEDGGASFTDHRPGAKRDVHSIAWHPAIADRVYEAAGDGAAWSSDGGRTWQPLDAGRDLRYCWALAADPTDPDRWYVSAASGPGTAHAAEQARGRLYRWAGDAWQRLPLPGEAMPYALAASGSELIAGMTDGRLMRSGDRGERWEEVSLGLGSIVAMAVAG